MRGRPWTGGICWVVVVGALAGLTCRQAGAWASHSAPDGVTAPHEPLTLTDAQHLFYNARYEAAAALVLELRASATQDLASDELRTSALLFQLKDLLEVPADKTVDKEAALKRCLTCPELTAAFFADIHHGQNLARTALRANAKDEDALFFLGKVDLNYIWLQLGLLGRKTGWDEFWEARRSLDAVLAENPRHVRARVARAWIDYIVDTKMPWGTRWVLGGGNKRRALVAMREAVDVKCDFFSHVEAEFAMWNMQVREHAMARATEVARRLSHDFPENREIAAFLEAR